MMPDIERAAVASAALPYLHEGTSTRRVLVDPVGEPTPGSWDVPPFVGTMGDSLGGNYAQPSHRR